MLSTYETNPRALEKRSGMDNSESGEETFLFAFWMNYAYFSLDLSF